MSALTDASASAEGREVMIMGERAATSRPRRAGRPPARLSAVRRAATGSKPRTSNPALTRLADIADPMIPRPIIPTVFLGM